MPSTTAARRGGGIRKHDRQRRDRDGDLVMGAAPRPASTRPSKRAPNTNTKSPLTELRVTGWTDDTEIPKIIKFLERHSAKRATQSKSGGVSPAIIKRSRAIDEVLTISVRPEDVPAFNKINGFSFSSQHGSQTLRIEGPGIRRRSPQNDAANATAPESPETVETMKLIKDFLNRRYDQGQKLLNLSSIASDEEIAKAELFSTPSRRAKIVPVLMVILDNELQTSEKKREAIHSVTLSNNDLPNLSQVKNVAQTLPHIKNLDLSGNKFENTRDLSLWKSKLRGLEHLILSDNPMVTSQPGWEQEIIRWYPRLRILNDQVVRTDEQIARLDAPKHTPVPSAPNLWMDEDQIGQNFLIEFIQGFDNDRNALVQKYYDATSLFTMSVNTRARGGAGNQHDKTPWDSYLPQSRNLKIIHHQRPRWIRKYRGTDKILQAFSNIPPTRHPALTADKYSMECQPLTGLPDPTGQYNAVTGLLVVLHGEYEEHRTAKGADEIVRRAFDRTFVLGPGGPSGVRVVTDMCCLRAAGGTPAWIPQDPITAPSTMVVQPSAPVSAPAPIPPQIPPQGVASGLTPEQEAMVLHVHQATKLTIEMATHCLEAANWNLEAAAQIFGAQKDSLPADAFVTN